jgi:hypothetical protein
VTPLSTGATYLGFFNAFFVLGIPIVGLVLWLGRTIFRLKSPAWLSSGLGVFWVLNFLSLVFLGGWTISGYRQSGSVTKNLDISGIRSDTLRVQWAGRTVSDADDTWFYDGEEVWIGNKRMELNGLVEIRVRPSTSGRFECSQTVRSRGSSNEDAIENASHTNFEVTTSGNNTLLVPSGYQIPEGKKWRVQEVRLTIGVPEGKSISFGDVINRKVENAEYADPNNDYYISDYPDRVFRMTSRGLVCSDCPAFGDSNYRGGRYYEKFTLEGNFETEIIEADDFSIEFEGAQEARDAVETIRSGENLTLTTRGKTISGPLRCIIKAPVFTSLVADNTGNVTIRGFDEGRSTITAKGPVRIRGFFDSRELDLTLSGKCNIELIGNGNELNATLTDGAELEASGWRTDQAEIFASDGSRARINANSSAVIRSDATSNVKVDGTANVERQ